MDEVKADALICAINRLTDVIERKFPDANGLKGFGGGLAIKCPVCQTVNFSRKDSYYECDFGHKWTIG